MNRKAKDRGTAACFLPALAMVILFVLVVAMDALMPPAKAQSGHGTGVYLTDGGDRMVVQAHGTLELQAGATISNAMGAGALAVTTTGLSLAETGDGVVHQTTWTLDDVDYWIVNAGSNGAHGSIQLYDFPEGYLKVLGTTTDLALDCAGGGVDALATYDIGVGSTATGVDNAALAASEQNIIAKIEGNAAASVVASIHGVNYTDLQLDGTSTAANAFFNVAFEADDVSATTMCTLSGTVTITWTNLGDYWRQ